MRGHNDGREGALRGDEVHGDVVKDTDGSGPDRFQGGIRARGQRYPMLGSEKWIMMILFEWCSGGVDELYAQT